MSDPDKDFSDAWDMALEDDADDLGGDLGVDEQLIARLRQLNPSMAEGLSTDDMLNLVEGAKGHAQETGPRTSLRADRRPILLDAGSDKSLLEQLEEVETRIREDKERLAAAIAKLQSDLAGLDEAYLVRILDLVLTVDPNLTSPRTQHALQKKQTFLQSIGYTLDRLDERQRHLRGK